jgi:hypothetical protein
MGSYKTHINQTSIPKFLKQIRWKGCKLNINEEFNIQGHCCQNFKLPKNIYFFKKNLFVC